MFFIQCPQTLLIVRMLTFIPVDMIRELISLLLARILYLTLAGVSLKTLFLLSCPYHIGGDGYITAKLLGLYIAGLLPDNNIYN